MSLFRAVSLSDAIRVYVSANAVLRATGIGRGILLTWLMRSQTEFGIYQLGLLAINVLLPVLSMGTYEGIARFVPVYDSQGQLWRYLRVALPFCLTLSVVVGGLLWLLAGAAGALFIGPWSGAVERVAMLRTVGVCVAALVLYHGVLAVLRGRRMFRAVSAMELVAGLLFTVSAVLVSLGQRGSGLVILGLYAGVNLVTAIGFIIPTVWTAREKSPLAATRTTAPVMLRSTLGFGWWAGWAAFFWQMLLVFPALYLNRLWGEEVLATYRAMTIFAQLGYVAPAAISVAVLSAVAKTWDSQGRQPALAMLDLASKLTLVAVIIGALIMASSKRVIMLMFPSAYRAGEDAVALLLLFYVLAGALSLVTIRFALLKQSKMTFLCWAGGCVVSVLLSVLLIGAGDPVGAVVRTAGAAAGGALAALATALALLQRRGLLPDRGTMLLLAGMLLLGGSPLTMAAGTVAIVLLCTLTPLIFSAAERQAVLARASSWWGPRPGSSR